MTSAFYSRYIPPKNGATASTSSVDGPARSSNPPSQRDVAPETSKQTAQETTQSNDGNDKKRKKRHKGDKASPQQEEQGTDVNGLNAGDSDSLQVTKKNERGAKRKRADKDHEDEPSQVLNRHKKILQKYQRSAQTAAVEHAQLAEETSSAEEPEPQGIQPLPQPEPEPEPEFNATFSSLPSWLAKPVHVPSSAQVPFSNLNIDPKLVERLHAKGFEQAFAVQAAVLPLLLHGPERWIGDLCVSAATGSGKTLSYVLPIVEALKGRQAASLRAVIVVPTRELVSQVREVCELCATGTGLQVGIAVGNQSLVTEQESLIEVDRIFDPKAATSLESKANEIRQNGLEDYSPELETFLDMIPGHVPSYQSKVDILICTPGRLVDHIKSTTGFSLDQVEWLVIDEADRLLDDSFQEWVDTINTSLYTEPAFDRLSLSDKMRVMIGESPGQRTMRKVILSATMTRDLEKLSTLKLRRPKFVSIGLEQGHGSSSSAPNDPEAMLALPSKLKEWIVPVEDPSEKPLYLISLLKDRLLTALDRPIPGPKTPDEATDFSSDGESSSESDSDSDSSSGSGSSTSSDSDLSEPSDDASESSEDSNTSVEMTEEPAGSRPQAPTALIFVSSNENTTRLFHLISSIEPSLASAIGTLTKQDGSADRKRILASFKAKRISIIIASDRASRGLDLLDLDHVINYDIPRSLETYVHRVGRTARAGKSGQAWTLVTDTEAGWFWNNVARSTEIVRGELKVERQRLQDGDIAPRREAYAKALVKLEEAVTGKG